MNYQNLDKDNGAVYKGHAIADVGNADVHYIAGAYTAPAAHSILTIGGTVTQTLGVAGKMYGAHAFIVASGAGGTDLILTVTGDSFTDAGVLTIGDSEIVVPDCDAVVTDQYLETTKKWVGQVTYTLTGAAGSFTFNYGYAKYEDYGNRKFTITDFEIHIHGAATETGGRFELLKHSDIGWTYSAAAFNPGNGAIADSLTDLTATYDNWANNDDIFYKRSGLTTQIDGEGMDGLVIRITTAVNNSIKYGTCHVGVTYNI